MLSHHDNAMNVQKVAAYAAGGDSLNAAYNKASDNAQEQKIIAKVEEFKRNMLAMSAQDFVAYTNLLAAEFNQQDYFQKSFADYQQLCADLLNPSEENQKRWAAIFDPSNSYTKKFAKENHDITYLIQAFVDCHDDISLKAMIATIPESMKNKILHSILPQCFVTAVLEHTPAQAQLALQLGMPADTKYPWRNFFGDTMYISLLTHAVYHAGQMLTRVADKNASNPESCNFKAAKLSAYTSVITALLNHGADPDFDKRDEFDDATPRGLARSKLEELQKNKNIAVEDKEAMAAVLRLVADAVKLVQKNDVEPETKRHKM